MRGMAPPEPEALGAVDAMGGAWQPGEVLAEGQASGDQQVHQPHPSGAGAALHAWDEEDDPGRAAAEWRDVYAGPPFRLRSLFPPIEWLPQFVRAVRGTSTASDVEAMGLLPFSLKGDVVAGLSVGVMLVPQCLAFALLAGLPVRLGLYASVAPLICYALTGTIRQMQMGPTAVISLLTSNTLAALSYQTEAEHLAAASLLSLLVGLVTIVLGVFRFGFVVDLLPNSVMDAWCTASGITIATSQLSSMLGISMPRTTYWWQTVYAIASRLPQADIWTSLLSLTLLAFLLVLRAWKQAGTEDARAAHRLWRWWPRKKSSLAFRLVKLVADLSSLISVCVGWLWGLCYRKAGVTSVRLVGPAEAHGLIVILPGGGLSAAHWSALVAPGLVIAVVGFLQTVAQGAKLSVQYRLRYDPNQELLAQGCANCVSGFFAGFPISGGFSRTASNVIFGATSQVAGVITAVVVLVATYLIMPAVELLPLAALAPLVVQGALGTTDFAAFRTAFHASRFECVAMVATFVMSLVFTVQEGLYTGVSLSILRLLHSISMPNMVVCGRMADGSFRDVRHYPEARTLECCVVVRLDARLCFACARRFEEFCLRAARAVALTKFVIMDFKSVNGIDMTGCDRLLSLAEALQRSDQALLVANLKGPVTRSLKAAGVDAKLRKRGGLLCWNMDQAVAIANGSGDWEAADQAVTDLDKRVLSALQNKRTRLPAI